MFRIHTPPLFTNQQNKRHTHSSHTLTQTHSSDTLQSVLSHHGNIWFNMFSSQLLWLLSLALSLFFFFCRYFLLFLPIVSVCLVLSTCSISTQFFTTHIHSLRQTPLQNIFLLCSLSLSASSPPPNQLNKQKNEFCPTPSNAIAAISSNFTRAAFVCLLGSSQP